MYIDLAKLPIYSNSLSIYGLEIRINKHLQLALAQGALYTLKTDNIFLQFEIQPNKQPVDKHHHLLAGSHFTKIQNKSSSYIAAIKPIYSYKTIAQLLIVSQYILINYGNRNHHATLLLA